MRVVQLEQLIIPLVNKTDTLATKCQYIKMKSFILDDDCFKLAKNQQIFFSFKNFAGFKNIALRKKEVELAFF